MTSELDEDKYSGYLLVKRNGEVIANYPLTEINLLKEKFKDKELCSTQEFSKYESLDDFVNSIYFLEFFEYFLYDLHKLYPDVSPYIKTKLTKDESFIIGTIPFKILIGFAYSYLYYTGNDLRLLYNNINKELYKLKNTKFKFENKEKIY